MSDLPPSEFILLPVLEGQRVQHIHADYGEAFCGKQTDLYMSEKTCSFYGAVVVTGQSIVNQNFTCKKCQKRVRQYLDS